MPTNRRHRTSDSGRRGLTHSGRRPWLRRVAVVAAVTVGAALVPSWYPQASAQIDVQNTGRDKSTQERSTETAEPADSSPPEVSSGTANTTTPFEVVVAAFDADDLIRIQAQDGSDLGKMDSSNQRLGSANVVAMGPDGLLYSAGDANRVVRYNPADRSFVDVVVRADSGIADVRGLAFRANGNLLVSSAGTNQVLEFNPANGQRVGVAAEVGLDNPGGIAVTDNNVLWVASQNNDAIIAYGEEGSIRRAVRTEPGTGPVDVTVGSDGLLYVAHSLAGRIDIITIPAGEPGRQAATAVVEILVEEAAELTHPAAVARGPDGVLWVADYWADEILRFDLETGESLGSVITAEADEGFGPTSLAFVEAETAMPLDQTQEGNLDVETLAEGLNSTGRGFEINQGQFDASIDAAVALGGRRISLVDGAILIDSRGNERGNVASLGLVGADTEVAPEPVAESETSPVTNYFIEDTVIVGSQGHAQVIYRDLLPGVDMRYTAEASGLTYDILLDAGVDPDVVRLESGGTGDITIDGQGRLVLRQVLGPKLRFSPPKSYQLDGDTQIPVDSAYQVEDDGTIGFSFGEIRTALPLVIDPTLDLSTFFGGTSSDYLNDVAIDASGNIVVVGESASTDFPTTTGAYDTTADADFDVVVSKLDATGSTLLWSTYIGGGAQDNGREIEVAANGDIVFVGDTDSGAYPTTVGAYATAGAAQTDGFVSRLSGDGSTLVASTLLAGNGIDQVESVELDSAGNIVVLGTTSATNFPSTPGAYQTADSTNTDLFVSKLSADLTALTWSTFLAGNGAETAGMLSVDATDGVWVVGGTTSTNMPTSIGAFDTTANGGDFWVGALSADGSALDYGTYLGGPGVETGPSSIYAVNSTEVHVATTALAGYPTTTGAYAESTAVADTAHVVLDSTATGTAQMTYGSFLGGTDGGWAHDITVDSDGRAYIVGDVSAGGLATAGAPDTIQDGAGDASLAVMDPSTATMELYTYIGGSSGGELATGVALNAANEVIVVGNTDSTDFATTGGSYQSTSNGSMEGFVQQYSAINPPVVSSVVTVNSAGDSPDINIGDGSCDTGATNSEGDTECTLRAAIQEANASATISDIEFDIPVTDAGYDAAGWWKVALATDLPELTAPFNLDGTTQPGYAGDPVIGITRSTPYGSNLLLETNSAASDSTIVGLAFGASTYGLIADGDRTVVTDNWFGFMPDGSASVIQHPILASGQDAVIGRPGQGNIFGNYHFHAIIIRGTGSIVQGNIIGEDPSGTADGYDWTDGGIYVSASNVLIGGTGAGEGNRIAQLGVGANAIDVVTNRSAVSILGNTIIDNGLAVDLGLDGATANDPGDGDTGSNNLLNYPVPTLTGSATVDSINWDVDLDVTLDAPAGDYRIEVYTNDGPGVAGRTEGQVFTHAFTVSHPGGGAQTFATSYSGPQPSFIGTTATEDNGDGTYGATSEFSAVPEAADLTFTVNSTGDSFDNSSGDLACDTGGTNSEGDSECTLRAAIEQANDTANGTIVFDIPASDPGYAAGDGWTINVASSFEQLRSTMTIDGATQPGWVGDPLIGVAGTSGTSIGLNNQTPGSVVNGLSISGFTSRQIWSDYGITITGSWVGYRLDATKDSSFEGIYIQVPGGPVVIGGAGGDDGNHIVGDTRGITVYYGDNAVIQGNVFGMSPDGTPTTMPTGIWSSNSNRLLIGGTGPGEGNVVANTTTAGIAMVGNNDDHVTVTGNTTYNNLIDIDLDNDGPTANDVGDVDTGVNGLLNHPDIITVASTAGTTTVDYTLDAPAGDYRIEVFADLIGGQTLAGTHTISHTGAGVEAFQIAFTDLVAGAYRATATGDLGASAYESTSEFSASYAVCQDPDGDGLCSHYELLFGDTDGDSTDNYLDDDDDDDGLPTSAENADPNGDGDPRDALDADRDGQPDWIDAPSRRTTGLARSAQKISDLSGGLAAALADADYFGTAATPVGDLDGDGVVDIAVSAPYTDRSANADGAVYILLMNADGTVRAEHEISELTLSGLALNNFGNFGSGVALVGDLGGDGRPELAVGTDGYGVWLITLNSDGTAAANPTLIDGNTHLLNPPTDVSSFGFSVGALGDLNGDGINDLLVGDHTADEGGWDYGAAHVIFLNADGSVADNQVISDLDGGLNHVFLGNDAEFGSSVTALGDIDGDGVTDVAVGSRRYGNGPEIWQFGAVHVLMLNSDGTVKAEQLITNNLGGLGTVLTENAYFGSSVAGTGDMDGNGVPDLLVGAPSNLEPDGTDTGGAFLFNLNPDGTIKAQARINNASPALKGLLDDEDYFAHSVAGLGDLDGNGSIDLLIGAAGDDDGGPSRGAVYIIDLIRYIVVNSTGDAGDLKPGDGGCNTGGTNSDGIAECTLRAAIEEANGTGAAYIEFEMPVGEAGHSAGVWTINPATSLPYATGQVVIDASTQAGWSGDPVVALDGSGFATTTNGLTLAADDSAVIGLSVINWTGDGISSSRSRVTLSANWFGIAPDGTITPNLSTDASLWGGAGVDNVVGGIDPADGNRFAAAGADDGLFLHSTNVLVANNTFGLAPDGVTSTAPPSNAIRIEGSATGINIDANTFANTTGTAIDAAQTGTATITNNNFGVDLVGGAAPVGLALAVVSAGDVMFGGTSGNGNTVMNTTGVAVLPNGTGKVAILGNSISNSGTFGIDLANNGINTNDAGDVDTGPNDLLNYPEITSAVGDSGLVEIELDLDVPAGIYRIELFANPSGANASGYGDGETLSHATSVTHAGAGAQQYSLTFDGAAGDVLTATATEELGAGTYGATSEFSAAVTVANPPTPLLDRSVRRSDLRPAGGMDAVAGATTGTTGSALAFDGSTALLTGPLLNINAGSLTLGARFQPNSLSGIDYLLSKQAAGGAAIYELAVDSATSEALATVNVSGSPVTVRGGTVSTGSWHDVVATWDGSTFILYLNGVEVSRTAASGSLATDITTAMTLGNRSDRGSGFDGLIDHIDIEHRVLSVDEVSARYANTIGGTLAVTVGQQQTGAPGDWTVSSAQARSGGFALAAPSTSAGSPAWAVATGIDEPGVVFESWWWVDSAAGLDLASGTRAGVAPTEQFDGAFVSADGWFLRRRHTAALTDQTPATGSPAPVPGTWVNVEQWTDQNGNSRLVVDGVDVAPWTGQSTPPLSGSVGLRTGSLPGGQSWFIDDPRARKLVMPEPVATLSSLDQN